MPRTRFILTRILLALLLAGFMSPAQFVGAAPWDRAESHSKHRFEHLPLIKTRQNHLLIQVFMNEKPALLVVDSGSPSTVISSKRAGSYGLTSAPANLKWPARVQVNGASSKLVIARSLMLGGLNVTDVPVVLADMSKTTEASRDKGQPPVVGILGADVLFAAKAVLDCHRLLLHVCMYPETSTHVTGLSFRGFKKMPMHVTDGFNSYVDGSINGTAAKLMVDTGAFATLLHRPFVRSLKIPLQTTLMEAARINLSDDNVDLAKIQKLSVGVVNIADKDVGVTDLGGILHGGLRDKPPVVGLLGGEILQRNHAIIDFGTRSLYLRPEAEGFWRRLLRSLGISG